MPYDSVLTRREREVVELVCQGHASKEVAARMGVGYKTVKTYLSNIYPKLGVHSDRELIAGYWRAKLDAIYDATLDL